MRMDISFKVTEEAFSIQIKRFEGIERDLIRKFVLKDTWTMKPYLNTPWRMHLQTWPRRAFFSWAWRFQNRDVRFWRFAHADSKTKSAIHSNLVQRWPDRIGISSRYTFGLNWLKNIPEEGLIGDICSFLKLFGTEIRTDAKWAKIIAWKHYFVFGLGFLQAMSREVIQIGMILGTLHSGLL